MSDAGLDLRRLASPGMSNSTYDETEGEYFVDTHTPRIRDGTLPPPEVAVILPIHNEARAITDVLHEIHDAIATELPTEIICTEDGSSDGTPMILKNLSEQVPLKILSSRRRKGYAQAIVDGVNLAKSKYVLFADSDGQHLASDFWKLYELRNEAHIVSGWRSQRADPFLRRGMSVAFTQTAKALFGLPPLHDVTAPFRLANTEVAKLLANRCKYMRESFWTEFTIQAIMRGYRVAEVPVQHRERFDGSSRVYKLKTMPEIAYRQLVGLVKTWADLRSEALVRQNGI